MAVFAVVAAAATLISVKTLASKIKKRDVRKVPGKSGSIPFIGHASLIKAAKAGKTHKFWEEVADEADTAGRGLTRVSVLGRDLIVVTSPDLASNFLKTHKWTSKAMALYGGFFWLGTSERSLLTPASAMDHVALRKGFTSFFSSENIDKVVGQLVSKVSLQSDSIASNAAATGSAAVDISVVADSLIDFVVRIVLFEYEPELYMENFRDGLEHVGQSFANPVATALTPLGLWRGAARYRRNFRGMRAQWMKLVQHAFDQPEPAESNTTFWACLRRSFPRAMTDKKELEKAVANAGLMYGASSETTITTLSGTLSLLAVDPTTTAKLVQELDTAELLYTAERPKPRSPSAADLHDLPVLNAVAHESLRYLPPAPSGTVRTLDGPTMFGDTLLPKGTDVIFPPFGIHMSTAAWGEDAKQFRPERWMEARSLNAAKRTAAGGLRWVTFSEGQQNCLGQHLAMMEMRLAVAMLVSRFHISIDPSCRSWTKPADMQKDMRTYITAKFPPGTLLTMRPRVPTGTGTSEAMLLA